MNKENSWMLHVCTIKSVPIKIHLSFFLFLAWIIFTAPGGFADSLWLGAFVCAIFICVLLHECGHVFTAKFFDIKTKDIVLYPFGGIAMLMSKPKAWPELVISIAGPIVNLLIATFIYVIFNLRPEFSLELNINSNSSFWLNLLRVNIFLAIFNLIPAIPMDGGRILRATLDIFKVPNATKISVRISQICSLAMFILGIYSNSFMLIIISVIVFLGAIQEMVASKTLEVSEGKIAKDYMVELDKLYCFSHGTTISDAIRVAIKSPQEAFPVIYQNNLLGLINRNDLIDNITASHQQNEYLSGIMDRSPLTLSQNTPINLLFTKAQENSASVVALVDSEGNFTGLLLVDRVAELIILDQIRNEKNKFLENLNDSF